MAVGGVKRFGVAVAIVSAVLAGVLATTLALPRSGAPAPSSDATGGPGPAGPGAALRPSAACGPSPDLTGPEKSRDAQFARWYHVDRVIHVLGPPYDGAGTAYVGPGQPLLIGFEWSGGPGQTPDELDASIRGNPAHDVRPVIDGTPVPGDWRQYYQPSFVAETQCGPDWSWDHDGDGPGDGNGNGVGDFEGVVLFWRAPLSPLRSGTHTLTVEVTMDGGGTWDSIPGGTITVV